MSDIVVMVDCPRCCQRKPADTYNPHICVDCAKAENSRYTYIRNHQDNWIAAAEDAGLDVWLRQPGETEWEYTVWCAYRDSYPGKKPSYSEVARQLNTTTNVVKKAAQRWTFQARMQAWIAECDRVTMMQRHSEILDMNADHINMSRKLREKLNTAIDLVEPAALKPSDIVALAKLAADMERKAQTDTMAQEDMQRELARGAENPELKKSPTKQNDLGEVVQILLQAGALGSVTQIGVRETREVVVADGNGQMIRHIEES